jgi:hypothetical protein
VIRVSAICESKQIQFSVDRETVDHLPALYRAVVEVLAARGEWVIREEAQKCE